MPRIFLSYRREDSAFAVDWIDHALSDHFGRTSIVRDIDTFPLGRDFRVVIEREVKACDILLAIIGDRWLDMPYTEGEKSGQRRIDDPSDFVRLELEAALQRDIPVIPVLVDRASMPSVTDLPDSLQDLIYRGATEVQAGQTRSFHIDRLISGITALLETPGRNAVEPEPPRFSPSRPSQRSDERPAVTRRALWWGVILGAVVIAAVLGLYNGLIKLDLSTPSLKETHSKDPPFAVSTSAPPELPKTITNRIGMEFVLIPAGTFTMGSPDSDSSADDDEKPAHEVTISEPFYMGKYEVTQAQWAAVMGSGNNPSVFKGDKRPVTNVSWEEVQEFIRKLNDQEKQSKSVPCRLPTEAEWEYAARAGTKALYSFGKDAAQLGDYAWYQDNSGGTTHPVGEKEPNPWGLYDMHGNVWEWVEDGKRAYTRDAVPDPKGPTDAGADRVIRGGSWGDSARGARSASRVAFHPGLRDVVLGFRCLSSALSK